MGEVLSQEEVDALLSGLTGGDIPVETDRPPRRDAYAAYDFTNQDRIVRGRLPTLEMVHERFTRLFRQSISSAMQRMIDVNVLNTEMSKFGEFMRNQAVPSSYHIFRMDPLKGSGLVVLEGKLIFTMVNNFFGGKGASYYKMEGRDFTPIETRLIKTTVELVLKDYQEGWKPVQKIDIVPVRHEINPQFVSIVPPSDAVWVVEIELSFEDISEKMYFCLPHSTIEPLKEKLKASYQSEDLSSENTWRDRIETCLRSAPVEFTVQLGTAKVTGRQVLQFAPGDIIQMNERSDNPLKVYVGQVLKVRGRAGSSRGNRAICVTEVIQRGGSE
ncbi:MAG TPA: flagellar motor switch protein FliM [Sumerlaeia bacterium]|nr:flagellar motor switch protein FliM [Sumerlaeia bacterium]